MAEEDRKTPMFNGRIFKLGTLSVSFASVIFDRSLRSHTYDSTIDEKIVRDMDKLVPHFDARVFNVPDNNEMLNHLVWRCNEAIRNSVHALSHHHIPKKQTHKKNTKDVFDMLKEGNINWEDLEPKRKYGTLMKREKYEMEALDPRTGNPITAMRTRCKKDSFEITSDDKNLNLIVEKYWPE